AAHRVRLHAALHDRNGDERLRAYGSARALTNGRAVGHLAGAVGPVAGRRPRLRGGGAAAPDAAGARPESGPGCLRPGGSRSGRTTQARSARRRRATGDYETDECGFDPALTDHLLLPLLRPFFQKWFRVETQGLENVPDVGGALGVGNHSGPLPADALMTMVALRDDHPAQRRLGLLGADLVFDLPFLGTLSRKMGTTLACNEDAERLLTEGEVVGVFPEGFKGIGKPFRERE